jgi:ABC-type spermidine/putrescine transport system permease subunit II
MLTAHQVLAFLVIAASVLAAVLALLAYWRRGSGGAVVTHALALAQTLVVAELAVGLLLLADDRHAGDGVHYMYGSLAVLAVAWPWLYAPREPRRRLAWFAGATLLAGVLALRAYMTA